MSRVIKFRGRCNRNGSRFYGEWVYGFFVISDKNGMPMVQSKDGVFFRVNPATVGQFTGLSDKNGNEIYEGDIVRLNGYGEYFDDCVFHVIFGNGSFSLRDVDIEKDHCDLCLCAANDSASLNIIGNIHDNPELMPEEDGE